MSDVKVEQRHRNAAAAMLGYRDWGDATDYRLTGREDRERDKAVQAFARFERDHLTAQAARLEAAEAMATAIEAARDCAGISDCPACADKMDHALTAWRTLDGAGK